MPPTCCAEFRPAPSSALQKTHLVDRLVDGLVVGAGVPYARLIFLWARFAAAIDGFVAAAVAHCGGGDGFALVELIQVTIARYGRFRGEIDLGHVAAVTIGRSMLFAGYLPPPQTDMVVLRVRWLRPATLFSFAVPALGRLGRRDLLRAVAFETRRRLSGRLGGEDRAGALAARLRRALALGRRVLRRGRLGRRTSGAPTATAQARAAALGKTVATAGLPRRGPPRAAPVHPGAGSDAAQWERFFATEDPWNYGSAYEQEKYARTLAMIPPGRPARALELACAEGCFTELLAPRVDALTAVDISATAVARARRRTARFGNVRFARHDLFADVIAGAYDLITCSEVLYFAPSARSLPGIAARIAGALAPGGHFVHAHAYELVDTPHRTGFDWQDPFGAGSIHAAFAAEPRLGHVRTLDTPLYRIDLFRRLADGEVPALPATASAAVGELDPSVAGDVVWNGAVATRAAVATRRVYRLPVLALEPGIPDGWSIACAICAAAASARSRPPNCARAPNAPGRCAAVRSC